MTVGKEVLRAIPAIPGPAFEVFRQDFKSREIVVDTLENPGVNCSHPLAGSDGAGYISG